MRDVGFNKLRVGEKNFGTSTLGKNGKDAERLRWEDARARQKQNVRLFNREYKADKLMLDRYGVKNAPYRSDAKVREKIRAGLNNQLMIDPSAGSATRNVNQKTKRISKAFMKLENYISGTGDEFENSIVLGANDELMKALREGGYDYLADQVKEYSKEFKTAKHYDDSTYARAMLEITKFQQEIRDRIDVDWIYSEVLDSPDLNPPKPKAATAVASSGRTYTRDPTTGRIIVNGSTGQLNGDWEPGQIR